MKKLLLFIPVFFLFILTTYATDYYIAENGNDNNNGTSQSTPWKSLNKLNAYFTNLRPGDRVLLRRGDTFYGSIIVNKSGSAGAPITIGTYGSGQKPIVTGFTTVSSWNNLGGNIWESKNAVSSLSYTNMVVVNEVNTPMGRWPNSGYITYETFVGNSSITSKGLAGSPNWNGAEAVIRKQRWVIDRNNTITSHSGNTINYKASSSYNGQAGYGFFIQNDEKTLDKQNEWYYNSSSKKLKIFSVSSPQNVKITTLDNLLTIRLVGNILVDNIAFEGSNEKTIEVNSSSNVIIQNCDLRFAGINAMWGMKNYGKPASGFRFENNIIENSNNAGISIQTEFNGAVIKDNIIRNTGMIVGMGESGDHSYEAIQVKANNVLVENNFVENVGHNAIAFFYNNVIIKNNFIKGYCFVKLDGAGIYTWIGEGYAPYSGQKVLGNIVMDGHGDNSGTPATGNPISHGIYMDEYTSGVEIAGNTVFNSPHTGIYINRGININIHDNVSYNNGLNQILLNSFGTKPISKLAINNNIFVAKEPSQSVMKITSKYDDVLSFGTFNNNIYARPIDDNITINVWINNQIFRNQTFAQWKSYMKQDNNSVKSPKAISNVNDMRLEYNVGSSSKTISLDGKYIDMRNVTHNGSITLAPYSSAVLLRDGPIQNTKPKSNAGGNKEVVLPTNSINLTGSGEDVDGKITNYAWVKVSGPSGGSISSPQSAQTDVTSLVAGVYKFSLKVTDNAGATDIDTCEINVQAAREVYNPIANAGDNISVILPTSTTTLTGSGYVQGGSITSYQWTKVSGPSGGIIKSSNQAETAISSLIAGTYIYELEITDNTGKRATSRVEIVVAEKNSLLPAVNPGNTENGLDYNYYEESSFRVLPEFQLLKPKKTGHISNFDIDISNRADVFAFKFTGFIDVPQDGDYTFYTMSDDGSSLYIDGIKVLDNDGIHWNREISGSIGLKAGKHSISVEYFQETGGKILNVNYAGPGISKRLIPSNSLYRVSENNYLPSVNAGDIVQGLAYKYYEQNSFRVLPDFTKLNPVKSGNTSDFDINISNRADVFAFEFDGFIDIPTDGNYTFFTTSDDGSKLYIDGIEIVNNDGIHWNREISGSIGLKSGKHRISVEYFQETGGKMLTVAYSGPGLSKRAIPATALFRSKFDNLLSSKNPINIEKGLTYSYYEQSTFKVLPDFAIINPIKKGKVSNFDISVANRTDVFAFKFTGYIDIPTDGQYTFYTTSDDGSNLYIDGIKIIDNDGIHWNREISGSIGLKAGKHSITVDYFQETGGKMLNVDYAGPEISKRSIPSTSLWTDVGFNQPLSRVGLLNDPYSNISEEVKVFPNPFMNHITVSLSGKSGKYEISLVDVNGKILWTKSGSKGDGFYQQSFDVNSIQRGIYFIRINNGDKISTIKIVK